MTLRRAALGPRGSEGPVTQALNLLRMDRVVAELTSSWLFWAIMSAVFAALTAIFAKVGVENVNADFATFIRTIVILLTLAFIPSPPASSRRPARSRGAPTRS